jgi:hypothetical protein
LCDGLATKEKCLELPAEALVPKAVGRAIADADLRKGVTGLFAQFEGRFGGEPGPNAASSAVDPFLEGSQH